MLLARVVSGHFYSIFDLQTVTWKGDKKMDEFRDLWDHYLGNMQTTKELQQEIEQLFLQAVETSEVLKHDIAYYHRLHENHPDKTYKYPLRKFV